MGSTDLKATLRVVSNVNESIVSIVNQLQPKNNELKGMSIVWDWFYGILASLGTILHLSRTRMNSIEQFAFTPFIFHL